MPSKEQKAIAKAIARQMEQEIAAHVSVDLAMEYAKTKEEIRRMEADCWKIANDARRALKVF